MEACTGVYSDEEIQQMNEYEIQKDVYKEEMEKVQDCPFLKRKNKDACDGCLLIRMCSYINAAKDHNYF